MTADVSHYDPRVNVVRLRRGATRYERFHERAHQEQCQSGALVWKVWRLCRFVFGLNYLALLWLEHDAMKRARRSMLAMGFWDAASEEQARRCFQSYLRLEEIEP